MDMPYPGYSFVIIPIVILLIVYAVICIRQKPALQKKIQDAKCYLAAKFVPLNFVPFSYWRWYKRNGYFLFSEKDTIALKNKRIFGYGVRPIGRIIGIERNEKFGDLYLIGMETDVEGDIEEWQGKKKVWPNFLRRRKKDWIGFIQF